MTTIHSDMWYYNGKAFTSEMIGEYYGFVYLITNLKTGKKYIGRKYFWSVRRVAVKGKKRKKVVTKESDWQKYYGSCSYLKEDVAEQGVEQFKREILSLHTTKGLVNYNETKQQFIHNVLTERLEENGERAYYNDNILGRYYTKNIIDKE